MDQQMIRVVTALCDDVGTSRANEVKTLVVSGEYAKLQELRVRPSDYTDPEEYFKDACVTDLLRKCDLVTSVDKEAAAVRVFWECETQNARTNARLQRFLPEHLLIEDPADSVIFEFIQKWRKEIASVLGRIPDSLTPRFGGGSTYADVGKWKTIPDKMSSRPTVTPGARCHLTMWGRTLWAANLVKDRPWISDPRTVRGNIFFTVPKDGLKFRGCAKEASLNISYQLDVGRLMKVRLKRAGIDLRQGQALHQVLAQAASVIGHLATIDMSNASDTVCRVLVRLLLPQDWFQLLDSLRSSHTRIEGRWVRLEKFSSMGNGFTFELESLLFATLARVVTHVEGGDPDDVSCYGDDLIAPTVVAKPLLAALRYFGFTPNEKKTFVEGSFRESCGGDYFNGKAVRPHYVETLPNEPQEWISLANGLRRMATVDGTLCHRRWAYIRRAWRRSQDPIPKTIRGCRGPEHLGDVVIHDVEEAWGAIKTKEGQDPSIIYVRSYEPIPDVLPWAHWTPNTQLAAGILGLPSAGVTPRGGVSGWKVRSQVASLSSTWLPPSRTPNPRDGGRRFSRVSFN